MIGRHTVSQADGRPDPIALPKAAGLIGTIVTLPGLAHTKEWGLTQTVTLADLRRPAQ